MASRVFTVEEANALLVTVRPLVEQMVEHRRDLLVALGRQDRVTEAVRGNGGGLRPQEPTELEAEIESAAAALARCVEGIQELGAIVKDLDRGLVDFPARRGSEEVLLCWQLGEDEIGYWHGRDSGFAGRKELPL